LAKFDNPVHTSYDNDCCGDEKKLQQRDPSIFAIGRGRMSCGRRAHAFPEYKGDDEKEAEK